jgi:hypothetical protein
MKVLIQLKFTRVIYRICTNAGRGSPVFPDTGGKKGKNAAAVCSGGASPPVPRSAEKIQREVYTDNGISGGFCLVRRGKL